MSPFFSALCSYHSLAAISLRISWVDLPLGTIKAQVSRGISMLRQLHAQLTNEDPHPSWGIAEIKARIDELREPYQTTMRLRIMEALSYDQIALRLHAPLGTVKARISWGLRLMGLSSPS